MPFECAVETAPHEVKMTLTGELDAQSAPQFKEAIEKASSSELQRLILLMNGLDFMASAGLRVLIFAKQKMGPDVAIHVVGPSGPVLNTLTMSGFHHSVYVQDTFSPV